MYSPCGGHITKRRLCAHTSTCKSSVVGLQTTTACDWTAPMYARKDVQKISCGPLAHHCTWMNGGRAHMEECAQISGGPSVHHCTWPNSGRSTPKNMRSLNTINQRSVVALHPTTWAYGPIHPPQHYKSTQDTLLSNFHFLYYRQILHCLKDQWRPFGPPMWASDPPLWASGLNNPSKYYKSTQDTLLSNFHFLHYTQIIHCLKYQWWAFGPSLWASGPNLNASADRDELGGHCKTILFYYFCS